MEEKNVFLMGLSENEAQKRLNEFGPNELVKFERISFFSIVKEEIREPMILLLFVVGIVYSLWGKVEDAITIFAIITTLVLVEVWNQYRAKKAISSLSKLSSPKTKVLRDGKISQVETEKIVPGDILILTPGTRIAGDCVLTLSYSLSIDESSLTGESFPNEKRASDEIFAGTLVVSGEGKAKVQSTGKNTKIGKLSKHAEIIKQPKTPLQIAMKSLAKNLIWFSLLISVLIPLLGIIRGQNIKEMVLTGLALAFAIIPEEFPIIITMTLGLGAYKLSKKNLLIKKLKAAETLGNTTVILTDKTGTITENKLKIVSFFPKEREEEIIKTALGAMTELSTSSIDRLIQEKAKEMDLKANNDLILKERIFGDGKKTKAIVRSIAGKLELFLAGAPEEIIAVSTDQTQKAYKELKKEAAKGRRVIAFSRKIVENFDKDKKLPDLENDMQFVGLISIEDPPRKGVKETIEKARTAGIRTIMVTGDHPETAAFIGNSVGINSDKVLLGKEIDKLSDRELQNKLETVSIFARATPENKYRLLKAFQNNKEVVAVTGDGINDTLALKGADIGISMGIKGSDAAKEASDIVLADDNYITITKGIFEGRKLFDNLTKCVKYYLSAKTALILLFILPVLLKIPFPFAPIQIIVLELFMDLAASAGFISEPAEKTIYTRQPRNPKENFFNKNLIQNIFFSALTLYVPIMIIYFYAFSKNQNQTFLQTYAFSSWIIGHILLAFVMRSEKEPLYNSGIFSNKIINLWALVVIIFLSAVNLLPKFASDLKLISLPVEQIGIIFLTTFLFLSINEIIKIISFKRNGLLLKD